MKSRQEIADKLYGLNCFISAYWITGLKKPKMDEIKLVNHTIGEIIKELRKEE